MTDKPHLYVVDEDGGAGIGNNNELDSIAIDSDEKAERMSFGEYRMTPQGLHYNDELIAGPFEILGRARDPQGDDWARWIRFKDADGRVHQVAVRDGDLHGDVRALAAWQNGIGRLVAGQRLGVLAISTAFAGLLVHLAGPDGGGIHVKGPASMGKTAWAHAAASVWGSGETYVRSWRNTANAIEGAAVLATDTVLVLDELGVIDSRELNAAVYQLAIGSGKGRARRDGSMRTPASWRVMLVSTGKISTASKIEEDRNRKAKAGQEVRVLDIPADAGKGYGAFDAPRAGEDSAVYLAEEIKKSAARDGWSANNR